MILWPLSQEHLKRLEDAFTLKFDATHTLELINDVNAGFIAFSKKEGKKPKTILNVAEPVILSLIIEKYLEPLVEHEYLHVYGKGVPAYSSLNPPQITPNNLWQSVQSSLTEQMRDILQCSNVIFQQEFAKDYIKFECEKYSYLDEKYGKNYLRASQLMTYGYLDAFSKYLDIDIKTYQNQSMHFDIYDKAIMESMQELITEFITLRKDNEDVNLYNQCIALDKKIQFQKNIFNI